MMPGTCKDCRFWERGLGENTVLGRCRRSTPSSEVTFTNRWPTTGESDWCGKWKPSQVWDGKKGGVVDWWRLSESEGRRWP